MNSTILENQTVERLARTFRRSPCQMNRMNESDAEIIRLGDTGVTLAITTDSIVEEIASGLYEAPYVIGWMAAMVNFSDLAAVGAAPAGLLIAETLPPDLTDDFISELQRGIEEGCRACGSFVLGGDTNFGNGLELTGCAVGVIDDGKPLSRAGCRPGQSLYCSGPLGNGNAFAISRFVSPRARSPFFPRARIREGQLLRGLATACMDTSDGALATLDQLMRVNDVGFRLGGCWRNALGAKAEETAHQASIPSWLLLAGQHGEFELLFTVAPDHEEELLRRAASVAWHPIRLGAVVSRPEISLEVYGKDTLIDTARMRNAAFTQHDNVKVYIQDLLHIDGELQKGIGHHG